jgi:hypothetical protein
MPLEAEQPYPQAARPQLAERARTCRATAPLPPRSARELIDIKKLGKSNKIGRRIAGNRIGESNNLGVGWEFVPVCLDIPRVSPSAE